jgi:predicted NUDIX family phosphoesterase
MPMEEFLDQASLAAIAAALVGALASFLGLIISKEQKVSEFRQGWISSLRTELADLIAYAIAALRAVDSKDKTSHLIMLNRATANVRLRLNAAETQHIEVLGLILELEKFFETINVCEKDLNKLLKELAQKGSNLLKSEWERVKQGEDIYRVVSAWSLSIFIAIFSVLVYFSVRPLVITMIT